MPLLIILGPHTQKGAKRYATTPRLARQVMDEDDA